MKLGIGTNDVEKYARIIGKQNVRKIRNSKLIMYAMRLKVCDAEHNERCTRRNQLRQEAGQLKASYRNDNT